VSTDTATSFKADGSLEGWGMHLLMGGISTDTCRPAIEWILKNELAIEPWANLKLFINSPGGGLSDAFALIDVMRGATAQISTVGIGEISSAGLLIFMSGAKGTRLLTPNTAILSHQYSWGSYGKEHELFAAQKGFDLASAMMINHYKKCTGLSEKKIREFLLPPEDRWLTAKEALKLGICDIVKEIY
jgi:ATP-dependent Clp protease protease subunit